MRRETAADEGIAAPRKRAGIVCLRCSLLASGLGWSSMGRSIAAVQEIGIVTTEDHLTGPVGEASGAAPSDDALSTAPAARTPPTNVRTMADALDYAEPRPSPSATAGKGPYAARLSNALASLFANGLRPDFPGILPDAQGRGQESRARTGKGYKKLDVNYSTIELGLALGVSIKSVNYRDPITKRYTKNYSRNDNELRAEATDYHQRQPYAVLVGVLFLPFDACDDAGVVKSTEAGISSFGAAVRFFRNRTPRRSIDAPVDLFERFFIGLYEHEGVERGATSYFDVLRPPPRDRRPHDAETLSFVAVLDEIRSSYDERNAPPFSWAP